MTPTAEITGRVGRGGVTITYTFDGGERVTIYLLGRRYWSMRHQAWAQLEAIPMEGEEKRIRPSIYVHGEAVKVPWTVLRPHPRWPGRKRVPPVP